jgi:hypothetical protein
VSGAAVRVTSGHGINRGSDYNNMHGSTIKILILNVSFMYELKKETYTFHL